MTPVNLMPRERRIKQMARQRTRVWVRFLRGYSVVLAAASVLVMLPAHAGTPTQESALARLDGQIKRSQDDIAKQKAEIALLDKQLETSRFVGEHPDWSLVMEAVSRAQTRAPAVSVMWWRVLRLMQTDVALESFDLGSAKADAKPVKSAPGSAGAPQAAAAGAKNIPTRETYLVKIGGYASSSIGALEFVHRLEKLEFAESVIVRETRTTPLSGAMVTHFDIEMTIPGDRIIAGAPEGGSK